MLKDHITSRVSARNRRARLALVFALVSAAALILAACGGGASNADLQYTSGPQLSSYALGSIGASPVGGVGKARGQGVYVAVIDGEIDDGHPDLRDAFTRDGNGYAVGRNVVEGHNDIRPVAQRLRKPRPGIAEKTTAEERREAERQIDTTFGRSISHGTHVSGIIAARDNSFGVVGVAPEAKLIPVTLFRNYNRVSYNRSGLSGLNEIYLADWNRRVAESVNYAASRNAFVINNSWGSSWFFNEIRSTDDMADVPYYYRQPNFLVDDDQKARLNFHRQIFHSNAITAWERAVDSGAAIIFAAGNDGWNSETGKHKIFAQSLLDSEKNHRQWTDYRDDKTLDHIRTKTRNINIRGSDRTVEVPANIPSLESSYFVTNEKLKGAWLAVVNVDKTNRIWWSSNGCGIARNFCLAAPGTDVRSTFVRGDKDDVKDQDGAVETKKPTGDVNLNEDDGYGTCTGTSMAAPVVSGALAVIKSSAPNLTARDAIKILLCSATDLDKSSNRPAKSMGECTQKGVEATHDNGWQPSEVYGHGLVNLARALQPIGQVNAAAGNGLGVAASADTRIAFSSAFGSAAPSASHHFGGLDSYGRVYRYRAPLQDRVLPGPRLAGVLALNRARPPVRLASSGGTAAYLQSSTDPDSAIGTGSAVSFIGARHRTDLSIASHKTSTGLSPAALIPRSGDSTGPAPVWQGLTPGARDVFSGRTEWQLSSGISGGAYFSRALAEGATRRGERYGMTDLGVSARIGDADSGVALDLGRLNEEGRFLGSKSEGGYALAAPTRSGYLRLSASRRLSDRVSVGVNVMKLRARVDFRHDEFVSDTDITARSAGAHLALADTRRKGDRLVLHYGEPLAVTAGAIRQRSVMGYNAGGDYRAETTSLDLGVRSRHRMTQVMYRTPLADGITGFAAAAHHRNWSHQSGLGNNLVMFGLSVSR